MAEIKEEKKWLDRWKEKLAVTYRLVVINDDSFEEVNTTKLTLLNLYTIASTIFVALAFLVFMLIVFTPLKRYIPGYGNYDAQQKAIELEQQISNLEGQVASYELWSNNIRKAITGQVDTTGTRGLNENVVSVNDRNLNVEKVQADIDLREAIVAEDEEAIPRAVNLSVQEKPLEQLFFTPPISGEVTFLFSLEKKHYGVDITSPKNTAVKAVMSGFVISSDWSLETGNTVCLQHGDNLVSFYKHNSALLKNVGDVVKAGEAIAIIGNTGDHSTGPHLHFELWHKGKPIDPSDYVNFN